MAEIEKVQKRDGRIVPFDASKIRDAVFKALTASGEGDGKMAEKITKRVVELLKRRFKKGEIPHVEQIQDIVEEVLILENLVKAAKAYILYREQRRRIREATLLSEEAVEKVKDYLEKLDWEVQENANMSFSLQGLNHYVTSYVIKKYWLNKIYPKEIREAEQSGDLHLHNLDTLGPYSFFGREVVVAKLNGNLLLVSFKDLYDEIKEQESLLNEKDKAFAKYPQDLFVLDKNGWVKVSRIVRKKKEREMRFIKSEQGQSIIVTDNHPFIIKEKKEAKEKEIEAGKVQEENHLIASYYIPSLLSKENLFSKKYLYLAEELIKKGYQEFFLEGFEWRDFIENWQGSLRVHGTLSTSNSANSLNNKLELTEDLGYLVGFFIAEGNYDGWRLSITASEKRIIKKIQRICAGLGIRTYIHKKEGKSKRLSINCSTLKLVFEKVFKIRPLARNKNLPFEILTYNLDFVRGVIAGIIDGDGSIGTDKSQIIVRVASRTMLEQLSVLLQFFGIVPRTGASTKDIGKKKIFRGKEIIQRYPLYRLSFSKRKGVNFPSFKYQEAIEAKKHWRSERYGWNKVLNSQATKIPEDFVYDITTSSNTFLCNSILVHNCVGWDLYDLLAKGFGGVPTKIESKPPKHFRAALGQVVNFMYTLQGECYSKDTQVLTENGWKYFYQVLPGEKVFTINPKTNQIELQKPYRFYAYHFNGYLYNFKTKKIDLLVTPGHRMLVDEYTPYKKERYVRKFVEAKDFNPNIHFIPRQGVWKGKEKKWFILPSIKVFQIRNSSSFSQKNLRFLKASQQEYGEVLSWNGVKIKTSQPISKYEVVEIPSKRILMDDWLKFFGLFLAEGCLSLRLRKRKGRKKPFYEYQIRISQKDEKVLEEFKEVLRGLPFNWKIKVPKKKAGEVRINDKQLFSYLQQFGKAENKFIPKEIKNLSSRQLKILFDWLMKGDGYIGNGNIQYYTKSERLAQDVQEIVMKLGWSANVYQKKKGKFKWYVVGISKAKRFRFRSKSNIKRIRYKGKVYCLEVPNHTLYVRRKGKAVWCGNCAGAVSFSNFDTLLAPFIRYDNLNYQQVRQALQEFLFNMAVPTRVGFQCLSEDTQILTPQGWKSYFEVEKGDKIYTFNLKNKKIEIKEVKSVFRRFYEGKMYNLKNRSQDQLISPRHRVVRRVFNTDKYILEPIEEILKLKSPIAIPTPAASSFEKSDYPISDEKLKILAWVLSEGSIENKGSWRVSIYQSYNAHPEYYQEIIGLLDAANLEYTQTTQTSLGVCEHIRLKPASSKIIHQWLQSKIKKFPSYLFQLSRRQARLFLETYLKGDGWKEKYRKRIVTTNKEDAQALSAIGVLAGFNVSIRKRKLGSKISKKEQYLLTFTETKDDYIQEIKLVDYKGVIWSVHTDNETVIAKRNGQVFITGNTPFTNITLDLKPSSVFAKQPVILGGKPQKETYQEFEEEMKIFNKALYEVYQEGDRKGRPFHFPIPTINITKDFPWDEPAFDGVFEASAKYGINYFCLTGDTKVEKLKEGPTQIKNIKEGDYIFTEKGFRKVKKVYKLKADKLIEITLRDGTKIKATLEHRFPTASGELKKAKELTLDDKLLAFIPKKITLSSGIELTPLDDESLKVFSFKENHLLRKSIEEIKKDEVVFLKPNLKFENITSLPKISFSKDPHGHSPTPIKVPRTFTPELARLLGYLIGDGNYYGSGKKLPRITFVNADKEVLEDFEKIIRKLFGNKFSIYKRRAGKSKKAKQIEFSSTLIRQFLLKIGLDYVKRENKEIPEIVFKSTKENIANFLRGLFETDGSISPKGDIFLTLSSKKVISSAQRLLLKLGILSKVRFKKGEGYQIQILGRYAKDFAQKVGFVSKRKKERYKKLIFKKPCLGDYHNLSPSILKLLEKVKIKNKKFKEDLQYVYEKVKYRTRGRLTPRDLGIALKNLRDKFSSSLLKPYEFILKNSLFCDRVISNHPPEVKAEEISQIRVIEGDFEVYDLTIDSPTHLFVIEGKILTHNSNYINSDMKPEDVRSMCCRLRLDLTELYNRGGGGLFGSGSLTGCYDEKTEILTENGWKLFKELTKEDKVFTLTEDNKIELHKPIRLFEYNYQGKMISFKGKSFDLLVTPNHRMVVDHKYKNTRMFVEAKDFKPYQHFIPKGGIWEGREEEYFVLPPVLIMQGRGPETRFSEKELQEIRELKAQGKTIYQLAEKFQSNPVTIYHICTKENYGNRERVKIRYGAPPLKIKMDDWLKFFGFWLAEGSTDNENIALDHGYRVVITQTNKKKREEIKKVLDKLPFHYYEEENNLVICNKQLWSYLRQFGNKYQKFIPKEIKELSRRQLKILFDWMVKGDGHVRKSTGQISYWTSSKRLADDLQEIILKLGWMATLKARKRRIAKIKGRKVKSGIVYEIGVQKSKHYVFKPKHIKEVNYKGKVYCCEVPNHTIFVRRKGKVTWCGNSIGVVTINLPRIGYLSKTKKEFFKRLGEIMDLAKEALEIKRKAVENLTEKGLYPYSKYWLQEIKKVRGSYWANHFSTIGLVGMNEALLNFLGENIASKRGRKFALEVMDFMRERLVKYQKETGNIYNLEATPAESTSFRLALKDKEKYPDIITAGTKKTPYYTNSTQLPVNLTDDIFEALKLQDELQCKYTGGTVFHIFLGERMPSAESVKILVKKIFENFHLPYITVTPTFSICPVHGYLSGEHFFCPKCTIKQPCEVYSRIVGYIRPVSQWNEGKRQEFKERKEFKIRLKELK